MYEKPCSVFNASLKFPFYLIFSKLAIHAFASL
jgi:hypothetical protein